MSRGTSGDGVEALNGSAHRAVPCGAYRGLVIAGRNRTFAVPEEVVVGLESAGNAEPTIAMFTAEPESATAFAIFEFYPDFSIRGMSHRFPCEVIKQRALFRGGMRSAKQGSFQLR